MKERRSLRKYDGNSLRLLFLDELVIFRFISIVSEDLDYMKSSTIGFPGWCQHSCQRLRITVLPHSCAMIPGYRLGYVMQSKHKN